MPSLLRRIHRWLGLSLGLGIVVSALTALVLNHRQELFPTPEGVRPGLYERYLTALAIDPTRPERLLAGTDQGIFASVDGGARWEAVTTPTPAVQVEAIEYDPGRPGHVYAALRGGSVLKSEDGGQAWGALPLPLQAGEQLAGLALIAPERLALLTDAGLHRQEAGGWRFYPRPARVTSTERSRGLLRLAYRLHDGQIWGTWGRWITDLVALGLLGLTGTGLWLSRRPRRGAPPP